MIVTPPKLTTMSGAVGVNMTDPTGRNPAYPSNTGYRRFYIGGYDSFIYSASSVYNFSPGILQILPGNTYAWSGYSPSSTGLGSVIYAIGSVGYVIGQYNTGLWGRFIFNTDINGIVNSIVKDGPKYINNCGGGNSNSFLLPYMSLDGTVIASNNGMFAINGSSSFGAPVSSSNNIYNMASRYGFLPVTSNVTCQINGTDIGTCDGSGNVRVYEVAQYASNNGACAANAIGATLRLKYAFNLSVVTGMSVTTSSTYMTSDNNGGFIITGYNGSNYFICLIRYPYATSLKIVNLPGGANQFVSFNDGYATLIQNALPMLYLRTTKDKFDMNIALQMGAPFKDPLPVNTTNILTTRYSK